MNTHDSHKFIFVSGLHKSGTSLLHNIIGSSGEVSAFKDTGVSGNEGQHLQSLIKPAAYYGGPGLFALNGDARIGKNSPLATQANRNRIFEEWGQYWDLSKEFLLEKSPPNVIRTLYLQDLFPESYFITIIRHPLAVAFATKKWSNRPIEIFIKNWLQAYNIYFEDRLSLRNELIFSYEELMEAPVEIYSLIESFLSIKLSYTAQLKGANEEYLKKWNSKWSFFRGIQKHALTEKYEDALNKFNYSLIDLKKYFRRDGFC